MKNIVIGKVTKPVGLKGALKVFSESDFINERFTKNQNLILSNGIEELDVTVVSATFTGPVGTVQFKEIIDRNQAELYRDFNVYINEKYLSELKDDYYYFQLLNLEVYNQNDEYCGQVVEVFEQPSSSVLRIKDDNKEFLVPFVDAFILNVDLQQKRIQIQVIEGML